MARTLSENQKRVSLGILLILATLVFVFWGVNKTWDPISFITGNQLQEAEFECTSSTTLYLENSAGKYLTLQTSNTETKQLSVTIKQIGQDGTTLKTTTAVLTNGKNNIGRLDENTVSLIFQNITTDEIQAIYTSEHPYIDIVRSIIIFVNLWIIIAIQGILSLLKRKFVY